MSEPTFICSAPELADSAQRIALYSHYAVAVAGAAVGVVMIMRSRVQEKLPHILGAIVAFGVGLVALYSQWEFNQYLYQCRESAENAFVLRSGTWSLWATLLLIGLAVTPGFRFKRMKKLALIPLIIFAVGSFNCAALGNVFSSGFMTTTPTIQGLEDVGGDLGVFRAGLQVLAYAAACLWGIPALVGAVLLAGTFAVSQLKKVEKRSEENHQIRTGIMTMVAVCIPAIAYGVAPFLISSSAQGLDKALLLFACAEVIALFFLLCATMSLLGTPANFPKPKKPQPAPSNVPTGTQFVPPDEQQAYAQAYAQQLYAQQQAYAQYYAQQQAAAAQQQGATPSQIQNPQAVSTNASAEVPQADPAAIAAYQQQQAQYYAQQQAYAAYQQQQQAYAQANAPHAQAYAQPQAAFQQQPRSGIPVTPTPVLGVKKAVSPSSVAPGGVKKIGGVRQVKKIR